MLKVIPHSQQHFMTVRTTIFLNEGDQVSVTNILFEQNNIWFGN